MQGDVAAADLLEHAVVALGRGDLATAERALETAYAAFPFDASTLRLLALLRRVQRRLDEAETLCRRAVARAPDDAAARAELGLILHAQGRLAESADAFRAALVLKPNNPEFLVRLGLVQQAMGDAKSAEVNHRAALRVDSKLLYASQALASALMAQDRVGEAETLLRQTIADMPVAPRVTASLAHDLGRCLAAQGRHEEAVAEFDRALGVVPDFEGAAEARAASLAALGKAR